MTVHFSDEVSVGGYNLLRIKSGANLVGVQAQVLAVLVGTVLPVMQGCGVDCIVTSGTDGNHRRHSEHYQGNAVDLRARHIPSLEIKMSIVSSVKDALNEEFLFQYEPSIPDKRTEHFHLEWRP